MNLNDRLNKVKEIAKLSVTDLATWFACNRGTMSAWLAGVEPMYFRREQISLGLDYLEKAVKQGNYFPIPLGVTQYQRKEYIQGIRDAVARGISKPRPSK